MSPSGHLAGGRVELYHGDCLDVLRALADSNVDSVVTDLAAGTAAEHLVCADLLLAGRRAFLAAQTCPYDVAVEDGARLVRVQVKATRRPRTIPQRVAHNAGYLFQVRRAGKGGQRRYGSEEFDIAALVALDTRQIAYLPIIKAPSTVIFRVHGDPGPRGPNGGGKVGRVFAEFPFARAVEGLR